MFPEPVAPRFVWNVTETENIKTETGSKYSVKVPGHIFSVTNPLFFNRTVVTKVRTCRTGSTDCLFEYFSHKLVPVMVLTFSVHLRLEVSNSVSVLENSFIRLAFYSLRFKSLLLNLMYSSLVVITVLRLFA